MLRWRAAPEAGCCRELGTAERPTDGDRPESWTIPTSGIKRLAFPACRTVLAVCDCTYGLPDIKLSHMKTDIWSVKQLFMGEANAQYWVPRYQRRYGWELEHLHSLWRDLGFLYSSTTTNKHFMGVLLAEDEDVEEHIPPLRRHVIDGQQRITTLALLLAALEHHHTDTGSSAPIPKGGWFSFYYRDQQQRLTDVPKLLLQRQDQKELAYAMENKWRTVVSNRPRWQATLRAYEYFRYCLWIGKKSFDSVEGLVVPKLPAALSPGFTIEQYWDSKLPSGQAPLPTEISCAALFKIVMQRLYCAVLRLEDSDGSAITVFDSINGKRLPFSQWDHCKAQFFRTLDSSAAARGATQLYRGWSQAEKQLVSAARKAKRRVKRGSTPFGDDFVYNLVVTELNPGDPTANRGRSALELRRAVANVSSARLPSHLTGYLNTTFFPMAHAYAFLRSELRIDFESEPSKHELSRQARWHLEQVADISSGPPEPVLLLGLHGWQREEVSDSELIELLVATERYLIRHFLARKSFSPLRSRFMQIVAATKRSATSLRARVKELTQQITNDTVNDVEIRRQLTYTTQIYTKRDAKPLAVLFRGIERNICGAGAHSLPHGPASPDFHVDHVYPQSCREAPNSDWAADLAAWSVSSTVIGERVDVLGNLGLLSRDVNRRARDASLAVKQNEMRGAGGAASAPLAHTQDILTATDWTPQRIDTRTDSLLNHALDYWRI